MVRAPFVFLCWFLFAAAAFAQTRDDAATITQARKLYESGKAHYYLTEYQEALQDFKNAYRLQQDPAILFNIAQCSRMLGDYESAARYYRNYKRELSTDADTATVEHLIAEMDRAAQERTRRQPPTGTKPPREIVGAPVAASPVAAQSPAALPHASVAATAPAANGPSLRPLLAPSEAFGARNKTIAGTSVAAAGVASVVGGIVAGVFAKRASDDINAAARAMQAFDPSKQSAGQNDQIASEILYAVGGAAVVGGAALLIVGQRHRARSVKATVAPQTSPHYAGATIQVRF